MRRMLPIYFACLNWPLTGFESLLLPQGIAARIELAVDNPAEYMLDTYLVVS